MDFAAVVGRLRSAGCVFAEEEARLLMADASTPRRLATLVARRASGVPIEHVLGWAAFLGRRVEVGPGVFVPRSRTGLLVREALAAIRPDATVAPAGATVTDSGAPVTHAGATVTGATVVDMCCGCGAVGAALLAEAPGLTLHAVDVDPVAVRYARRNLPGATVHRGDLFEALPEALRGRVDVVVANAPYVPTDALDLMPPEARDHEPVGALDGGADGLDVVRRIVAATPAWLAPTGHLLVETSGDQCAGLVEIFTANGFVPRVAVDPDIDGTVVIGLYEREGGAAELS